MIATAALAGSSLLAEVSFSRSGRRKMAGSVLDDGSTRSTRSRLQKRAFRRSERALRRKVSGII